MYFLINTSLPKRLDVATLKFAFKVNVKGKKAGFVMVYNRLKSSLSLERSKGGIENVLVIIDHFRSYAHAFPTKNQTAQVLFDQIRVRTLIAMSSKLFVKLPASRNPG